MKVRNETERQKGTRERMICLYVYIARERRVRERERERERVRPSRCVSERN